MLNNYLIFGAIVIAVLLIIKILFGKDTTVDNAKKKDQAYKDAIDILNRKIDNLEDDEDWHLKR